MTNQVTDKTEQARDAASHLEIALRSEVPIVAILGQASGWTDASHDPVLPIALENAGRSGDSWNALLSREALRADFYDWLGERFLRRAPSPSLEQIGDTNLSAIFTSSIDPGIAKLFSTNGREPEIVLVGHPRAAVIRSRRRPPVYYLFGSAGPTIADGRPPTTTAALAQRRIRHANGMLANIADAATALGVVLVDGIAKEDWLRSEDLLAMLAQAAVGKIIWFGDEPKLGDDVADLYASLVETEQLIRDDRSLAHVLAVLRTSKSWPPEQRWDEPEVVTLAGGQRIVTTPKLRLATQASAIIVDDSWLGFLPPLAPDVVQAEFHTFHGVPGSFRTVTEGIQRDFAISRDFEQDLKTRVERALGKHHDEPGAIILHGQSGVGKTIALARLALRLRESRSAAVLVGAGRFPQATDVSDFLALVDKAEALAVLIVDANVGVHRYDELLRALRSRGHRVVVVGSCYKVENKHKPGRFIEAPARLSPGEQKSLLSLTVTFAPDAQRAVTEHSSSEHALVRFYWDLPVSRGRLSEGLGREARSVERELRVRGTTQNKPVSLGDMGRALVEAGFQQPTTPLLSSSESHQDAAAETPADRVIDYVMVASRLYQAVPVNLVLRAVLEGASGNVGHDLQDIHALFGGLDIFRWRFADEEKQELLISSRLQIEAEFICNMRLGGPANEAMRLVELIRNAYHAGDEFHEETRFLIDIVYALGPDGPFGDRYRDSYADVARALTELRHRRGVSNARLILQESALRRAYVRRPGIAQDEKAALLDEASRAVEDALQAIGRPGDTRLHASRRTRDNLWVERAATYGFLATDSAQRNSSAAEIWSSYLAAREAVRHAAGRVDTYFPLDIGLWLPAQILREATNLDAAQQAELRADIESTLDLVDPTTLESDQFVRFQQQRLRLAEVLDDATLSDEAFKTLDEIGSAAGYYLRAKALMPVRPEFNDAATDSDIAHAKEAADYLWNFHSKITSDSRCLRLLLSAEWTRTTGRWLFRGLRQPLPYATADRVRIRRVLADLIAASTEQLSPRYRYLEAVFNWLTNDETASIASWRALARETEFIESGRVLNRHVVADSKGEPARFEGLVERRISDGRWSVLVPELNRHVDLVEKDFGQGTVALGRTIRGFGVAFNYIGPLADGHLRRTR